MAITLGQLPPAELARLKAELAETIVAHFCYPRFYDYRTDSLRMRPVDRAKRQEVWLYLSSVDFTVWGRIDVISTDFQRLIERIFIQFVQRNRSFFSEQGRKRMSDVRMLIGTSAISVVQGLRSHITGQKQNNPLFGSPRPAVSWVSASSRGHTELTWEQMAAQTMLLQQQLQEARGEIKPATPVETRPTNGATRRTSRSQVSGTSAEPGVSPLFSSPPTSSSVTQQATTPFSAVPAPYVSKSAVPLNPVPTRSAAPAASIVAPTREQGPASPGERTRSAASTSPPPARAAAVSAPQAPSGTLQTPGAVASAPAQPSASRAIPQFTVTTETDTSRRANMDMPIGEDDIAIFEQMRHQLVMWLRVEAVRAGIDISGQSPSQLLELARQQGRMDETRLQVVSTLLNLANQVIKDGQVNLLDYKQALMLHLMHTRGLV